MVAIKTFKRRLEPVQAQKTPPNQLTEEGT